MPFLFHTISTELQFFHRNLFMHIIILNMNDMLL